MSPKPRLGPPRATTFVLLLAAVARADFYHGLSAEAASIIPSCVMDCFQSFVDVNFSDVDCSKTSSLLQCVCRQTGASGHTIGEGAAQCLLAAKRVGICSDKEANGEFLQLSAVVVDGVSGGPWANVLLERVMGSAYGMCAQQEGAARPTHQTIEATMIVDRSSRLIVPTPSPSMATSQATNAPTTLASFVTITTTFSQPSSESSESTETGAA
ncbi:hypothetical protein IMZ48_47720, partial [Candidatus Bathyarchaeota archaeon]|nr:hypothetical protein [Candidatus Bathyarchaeota archaeon]